MFGVLDQLPAMVLVVDANAQCYWVNNLVTKVFGDLDRLLGKGLENIVEPSDVVNFKLWLGRGERTTFHCRITDDVGGARWIELMLGDILTQPDEPARWFLTARDVTDERRIQAQLQASEARYAMAAEAVKDGMWDWDMYTQQVHLSVQAKRLLGLRPGDTIDSIDDWFGRIYTQDLHSFQADLTMHESGVTPQLSIEHRIQQDDGDVCWLHVRGRALREEDGSVIRMIGSMTDITDRKVAEARLEHEATHDRLTGLPNRQLVGERLAEAIVRGQRVNGYEFAFMFLDFDRFKVINDSLGHDVGDQLLMSISRRLKRILRGNDIPGRMGGDEFVVLLDGVESQEAAINTAERIQKAMSEPHILGHHEVTSTASIGIVFGHHRYRNAEEVIRDADNAMYVAKTRGKDQYVLFDEKMHAKALRRLDLEHGLRGACDRDEIHLLYQPIVSLQDGCRLRGFEALVRWKRGDGETVSPMEFVPLAEEIGEIQQIGEFVFRQACKQAVAWNKMIAPRDPIAINVNVSRRQLVVPEAIEAFRGILEEYGCDPSWIKVEITESTVTDERFDVLPVLENIRDMGLALAMDDFGTGQSSLSCLHRFPLQVLKIDKSFVNDIADHHVYTSIAQAIVSLAHSLGFEVVAEGVETEDQLRILSDLACSHAQGYLFARPLTLIEAEQYMLESLGVAKAA